MTMTWRRRIGGVVTIVVLTGSGGRPIAQNSSQFRDWTASVLADATRTSPRAACATLVAMTGYEFSIITATTVAATNDAPEFCRATGQIQPEIRFEASLPSSWNGRLYVFGNGGYAGEALDAPGRVATARRALSRGFAVAQMNTGHDAAVEPLGTFAANSQKFLDYAYRGMHVTVLTAKKILQTYYDGALRHSYFDGCSTGGRQALISAQRFPDDFDGVVAGAPVLNFSGTMIDYVSNQKALAAAPIAPEKLKLVADAVYKKCDAIDGVADGLIDDPRRCRFKPADDLPRCANDADGPACFTAAQLRTRDTIYSGVKRNGAEFFPGWPVGAEIGVPGPAGVVASAWMPWFVAAPNGRPIQINFGETFFKQMAFGKPNPSYDWLTFDVDADLDKIQ